MRTLALALALAALRWPAARRQKPPRRFSQAALDKALADPARKDAARRGGCAASARTADRACRREARRQGLGPDSRAADTGPASSRRSSAREGKVYAVWPQAYARFAMGNVQDLQKLSADKYYGNIVTEVQPSAVLSAPEPLDVVWTSQNYHDYPDEYMGKDADPNLLNKAVFKILKPGGTYHDHRPYGEGRARHGRHREAAPDRPGDRSPAGGSGGLQVRRREQGARTTPPTRSTSRCSTRRSAATPASSPISS